MSRIIVHGGGLVGRVLAIYLGDRHDITVVEKERARVSVLRAEGLNVVHADLLDSGAVEANLEGADLAIGALPGDAAYEVLERTLQAGCKAVDVATFERDPRELDGLARQQGLPVVVDAGIAPGLANMLAGHHAGQGAVDSYTCWIGSLPVERELPIAHRDHYPAREALGECIHPARVMRNGHIETLDVLHPGGPLQVPGIGTLQSFPVDGLGTLLETLEAPNMQVYALRHPEHYETLCNWHRAGLLSPEPVTVDGVAIAPLDLVAQTVGDSMALGEHDADWLVLRVEVVRGTSTIGHELVLGYDDVKRVSALSRATAAPCSGVAELLLDGSFSEAGVHLPESIGRNGAFFERLLGSLERYGAAPQRR